MNKNNLSLVTERFIIRSIDITYSFGNYLDWINNEKYIVNKINTCKELVEYIESKSIKPDCLFLAIHDKKTYSHIGNIKFEPIDYINKSATLGILIGDQKWQGCGVGFEVISYCCDYLYSLGIAQFSLGVDKDNSNAIKLYNRLGFRISSIKDTYYEMVLEK
jgi:RimJ/RimL family protein N-acetyltransferase